MDNKQRIDELLATLQPMSDYKDTFVDHCAQLVPRISTGLLALDKVLNGGFANELYIMAAETSTGKSAFLMSLAQKIAESGVDVLYFALEMGRDEFVARGISSLSFQHNRDSKNKQLTAANILYWTYDELLGDFTKLAYSQYEQYSEEYFSMYGSHLHIIESGLDGLTVKDIANLAAVFKKRKGKSVVVFVDYLQIIKADPEDRSQSDRKTKMDVVVTTLKTLASQIGMPVVTVSSISRANYSGTIGTSAFKESGDTEYTGGVLIGWNWSGVTDQKDKSKQNEEKVLCKKRGYRKMELGILKYRNSERDSSVHLKYYPAFNYFEEDKDWKSNSASEESDEVWVSDEGMDNLFDSKKRKTVIKA